MYFCSSIHQDLSLGAVFYWIGLSDQESEGNFVWVNGDRASDSDEDLWLGGKLINADPWDCGWSRFDAMQPTIWATLCSLIIRGICEKPV